MTTVVVVDDHPVVRAGMRALLESARDLNVLAEGSTGAQALELVVRHRPDVLVLDVNLPDLSGLEVARRLQTRGDTPAILILSVRDDRETIFELLESGAAGYVLKDEAPERLVRAVRVVARGESWLSPSVARQVIDRAVTPKGAPSEEVLEPLTPRENEVLSLLAQGLDNAAIAERLVVTKRTVQNHVSTIYSKLGVSSRTQAALYALRHGLAQIEPGDVHDR